MKTRRNLSDLQAAACGSVDRKEQVIAANVNFACDFIREHLTVWRRMYFTYDPPFWTGKRGKTLR